MRVKLIPTFERQLTLYLFVMVVFAVGILFGALMVSALTLEQQQRLGDELTSFTSYISAGMFPDQAESFWHSLWFYGKWLLLVALLGFSVVGFPFVLALDFLKGVLIGFTMGTMISQHAWKGLLFSLLSIVPPNLFAVPALIVSSVAALSFSIVAILQQIAWTWRVFLEPSSAFVTTTAVMFLALVGASFVDAYMSPSIMKWAAPLLAIFK